MKNNYSNPFAFFDSWKQRIFLLLAVFAFSFATSSFAQDYANDDFEVVYQPILASSAAAVGIGPGNEAFNEVGITALGSTTNNVLVTINLAPGISYIPGTAAITSSNPKFTRRCVCCIRFRYNGFK